MIKIGSVLDADPDIADDPARPPMPPIDGTLEVDDVRFAYGVERGHPRHRLPRRRRRLHRAGRSVRRRQVDAGEADRPLLRPHATERCESTATTCGASPAQLPAPARRRAPGPVPVRRHDRRQHPVRPPRRDRRRGRRQTAAVGVDRVARALHGGLDHVVREGGAGLSAGERQLISIARALLADPRILILDEATSNIDRPTEILIENALDRLLQGRTSVIIAHRLATVRRADEVLVVERGRIVQRGPERELHRRRRPLPAARARARRLDEALDNRLSAI